MRGSSSQTIELRGKAGGKSILCLIWKLLEEKQITKLFFLEAKLDGMSNLKELLIIYSNHSSTVLKRSKLLAMPDASMEMYAKNESGAPV